MPALDRSFQVFAKPAGPLCNLACTYCYYLDRGPPSDRAAPMSAEVLEAYVARHLAASPDPVVSFSWHGGEPTLLGLGYFRDLVALQRRLCPPGRRIANGLQTNGVLLDEGWARFLAAEGFRVGLSLDGPAGIHDRHRLTRGSRPTQARALEGFRRLQRHGVPTEVLCVVTATNGGRPLEVYRFFREIGARYLTFLPMVEPDPTAAGKATADSVPSEAWGEFLCAVFDEWKAGDVGRLEVQLFEETLRVAFGQEHALCVLRPTCGDVPVVERDGQVYSCDHFVDAQHGLGSILVTPLEDLLDSVAQRAFGRAKLESLPRHCRECDVRAQCNGGCPKDRFARTPDGEPGLSYLCAGYRRFFHHARPFVSQVAALARRQAAAEGAAGSGPVPAPRTAPRPGRNDPCPCGSGRKYKHCCRGR
ncbi:MAG: anaerobic sulfatase maturase [Gemmatimonadota bacterium]